MSKDPEILEAKVVSGEAEEFYNLAVQPVPAAPVQKIQTSFQTALAVIKPRNLANVERMITEEAKFAKDTFFYSFPMGGKQIEGASIELAQSFMRAWGNCAVETVVSDVQTGDGLFWEFTSYFIDLERGSTFVRVYRRKAGAGRLTNLAKKDPQRVHDINFGAAQSISQRNAVLAAAPKWLVKGAIETAKTAIRDDIRIETPARSIEKAIAAFTKMGVTVARIETALGKPKADWAEDEIISMRGFYNAINEGHATVEMIFPLPPVTPEPEAPKKEAPAPEQSTAEDQVFKETADDAPAYGPDPVEEPVPGFFDNPVANEPAKTKKEKK